MVFDVPFPPIYLEVLSWLSVFELDLFEFFPISCAVNLTFYHTLVARTLIPLVLIIGLAAAGHCLNTRHVHDETTVDIMGDLGPGANAFAWCALRRESCHPEVLL